MYSVVLYAMQETLMKDYQNLKFQQPYEQALYYCSLILEDQMWHWTDVLEVLRESKAEHLATFVPRMLSKTFLKCYVSGLYYEIDLNFFGSTSFYLSFNARK